MSTQNRIKINFGFVPNILDIVTPVVGIRCKIDINYESQYELLMCLRIARFPENHPYMYLTSSDKPIGVFFQGKPQDNKQLEENTFFAEFVSKIGDKYVHDPVSNRSICFCFEH